MMTHEKNAIDAQAKKDAHRREPLAGPHDHGGDRLRMAEAAGRDPASLLDFSVNIRPEGPPDFIRRALFRATSALDAYPSPHAEEACRAAARHHGLDAARFVFGNGSNELIHALARALKKRGVPRVCIVEPAFSEYALACGRAGLDVRRVWGGIAGSGQNLGEGQGNLSEERLPPPFPKPHPTPSKDFYERERGKREPDGTQSGFAQAPPGGRGLTATPSPADAPGGTDAMDTQHPADRPGAASGIGQAETGLLPEKTPCDGHGSLSERVPNHIRTEGGLDCGGKPGTAGRAAASLSATASNGMTCVLSGTEKEAETGMEGWPASEAFPDAQACDPLAGTSPAPVRDLLSRASPLAQACDLLAALADAPAGSAVFLANPGNPSGLFRDAEGCLGLMRRRPDLLWIIDEAFIEYAGPEEEVSVLRRLPANGAALRSLTKFHAVPGVRLGYLAASPDMAGAVRAEIPAWSVNAFALAAALAVFADRSDFAERSRAENAERRADLAAALSALPGVEVYPSAANYLLFRWPHPLPPASILLKQFGIALRDCSNYHGLGQGWFRAAVRFPADHRRLADALRAVLESAETSLLSPKTPHAATSSASQPATPAASCPSSNNPGKPGQDAPGQPSPCTASPDAASPDLSPQNQTPGLSPCPADKDSIKSKVLGKRGVGGPGEGERTTLLQKGFLSPSPGGSAPALLSPRAVRPRRTPALMLQGTSSNAGKSVLAAAFCRIFRQDGHDVAPFKAQNMSLNSGVTATGDEMGRAQIVQAQAARVDPDARMNPILLKPHSDTGSQVVVLGQPAGHMGVLEYFQKKRDLWPTVRRAYDEVAASHGIMVLEGAGSPGEINLKSHDLVNMRMADYAGASVLLVGDIDRGGVYASFLGTWMTFSAPERRLLAGYLVNRFRGDASLLGPAHQYMLDCTGVPVLGTIPHIRDLNLPEEDMAGFPWGGRPQEGPKEPGILDIAVVMPRHVSNYTDFAPLGLEPDVRLRPVRRPEDWGEPDVIMIPGSKSVVPDLEDLRRSGLADRILEHGARGKWLFGICGGLQMLGRDILDPLGVESAAPRTPGLGLMDLRSTFAADKTLVRVARAETPLGVLSGGYEIHHGRTEHGPSARPLFLRADRAYADPAERVCGYADGRRWATYLHGIFDDDAFRRAWLDHVRADIGLTPQGRLLASYDIEKALDRLADIVRENCNLSTIYHSMGL